MRCVIICGAPHSDVDFIKSQVTDEDYVICADSGLNYALAANISINLIVGDFDSYDSVLPNDIEIISLDSHKDDTDSFHCVIEGINRGFKDFLLLGAVGGRTDHSIANISILQYLSNNYCNGQIKSKYETIYFLNSGTYHFRNLMNKTFSLFPFGCKYVDVSYDGVEYPLENYSISSSVSIGISNIFNSQNSHITIHKNTAILIINEQV